MAGIWDFVLQHSVFFFKGSVVFFSWEMAVGLDARIHSVYFVGVPSHPPED